jgi:hypothetical protein
LARRELNDARKQIAVLRQQLVHGDLAGAQRSAELVSQHARRAHQLTTGPAWAGAAAVPVLGSPAEAVRGMTKAVDQLGQTALPSLVAAAQGLDPAQVVKGPGVVDVDAIARAAPAVHTAAEQVGRTKVGVRQLPGSWLGAVRAARTALLEQLDELDATLDDADRAAAVAPTLLGAQRPQRYFVGLLNTAESRGVGGLPGAFLIVEADRGHIQITHYGSDTELMGVRVQTDLGREYQANWGQADPTGTYVNTTLSPHFPYAAQLWAAMWQKKSGQAVDGALSLDPTALSYLLTVTGPGRTAAGQVVSAGNVVALTEQVAYARYPDVEQRKAFLLEVAKAADDRILGNAHDMTALMKAAGRAASERRLLLWSADEKIEARLADLPLSGTVPDTSATYAAVVVNNAAGGKLDYYLDRSLHWQASGCGPTRTVTVTITLTNNAPKNLPPYVTTRADHPSYPVQPGDNRLLVSYYGSQGGQVAAISVDGTAVGFTRTAERGHPIGTIDLELPRGATRTVVVTLTEPTGGAPTVAVQPLVETMTVDVVKPTSCR